MQKKDIQVIFHFTIFINPKNKRKKNALPRFKQECTIEYSFKGSKVQTSHNTLHRTSRTFSKARKTITKLKKLFEGQESIAGSKEEEFLLSP